MAFDELGFSRTARRIMDGYAYYPASLLEGLVDSDPLTRRTR